MDQNLRGGAGHPRDARPRPPKVSAATYWRRRVTVMGIGVGLITTVSWGVNGLLTASSTAGQAVPPSGAGAATSSPAQASTQQARPTPSPSPSPDPTPSQHHAQAPSHASRRAALCRSGAVTLSLSSPQYWYQSGSTPRFTVRASSSQSRPCRFNMGTKFVAVVITDHGRRIWSSADCPTGARSQPAVLTSSRSAVLRLTWDRRTSSPDCGGITLLVRPGEYQATASVGRLQSKAVPIVLGAKGASGP